MCRISLPICQESPPQSPVSALSPLTQLFPLLDSALQIGDGAIATMLQTAGLPPGEGAEAWSLRHPEQVAALHREYAAAGAAWSTANTFGANRVRLAAAGLAEQVDAVNRAAVAGARQGAPGVPVLGSLGPTTSLYPAEWEAAYQEQAEALAAAGVDAFLVETIVSLPEGLAAVRAAAATRTAPIIATYTPAADGGLLDGTPAERALEALAAAGAAAAGVNCGEGPESLRPTAARLVAANLLPIFAAPNAGLPELHSGTLCYRLSPDAFAGAAIQFQDIGVRLFAGCCGTTPRHIQAARSRVVDADRDPRAYSLP